MALSAEFRPGRPIGVWTLRMAQHTGTAAAR